MLQMRERGRGRTGRGGGGGGKGTPLIWEIQPCPLQERLAPLPPHSTLAEEPELPRDSKVPSASKSRPALLWCRPGAANHQHFCSGQMSPEELLGIPALSLGPFCCRGRAQMTPPVPPPSEDRIQARRLT